MADDWGYLGRPVGLIKFGLEAHMRALLRGVVYLNTLEYFAKLESDSLRGDPGEALALHKWMGGDGRLEMLDEGANQWGLIGTINSLSIPDTEARASHAFCMYALRTGHAQTLVDCRNFEFGDTCVVFVNGDEFIRRVRRAAEREGFKYVQDLITYVERDYDGRMGPFRKLSTYSYQSEFRILLSTGRADPVILDVGDLSDIALISPMRGLNDRIRLVPLADVDGAAGRTGAAMQLGTRNPLDPASARDLVASSND